MATKAQIKAAAVDGRTTRKKRAPRAKETERTAWLGMSEKEMQRPGATLLAWLYQKANEDGLKLKELAERLGVTHGYIAQLKTGARKTTNISDSFATACAEYLGVPRIAVLMAAGRVRPEDFYLDPELIPAQVSEAMKIMRKDPQWGGFVSLSALKAPYEVQRLIVMLYEEATGQKLLPDTVDLEDLTAKLRGE